MDNAAPASSDYMQYTTTVSALEEETGFTFFPALSKDVKGTINTQIGVNNKFSNNQPLKWEKSTFGAKHSFCLALLVQSCKNDDYRDQGPGMGGNGKAQFTSSIGGTPATRVTGNTGIVKMLLVFYEARNWFIQCFGFK